MRLDRSLNTQQLEERIEILDRLCFLYQQQLNSNDAAFMKRALIETFGIPTIPKDAQAELSHLESMSNISEGAENKNIFYRKDGRFPAVLKITKERHDDDFYSVLKLMRNMHVVAPQLNRDVKDETFRAELPFEDMTIYLDEHGKFKRIIRQPYASGTPMKQLPDYVLQSPAFQRSWKDFLVHLRSMEESAGVMLDVTDSSAGFRPERGRVQSTENVFVRQESDRYVFTVIDPDVFDTREGEHKFSPQENIRFGQRSISSAIKYLMFAGMNAGRVVVKGWQDNSMRRHGR